MQTTLRLQIILVRRTVIKKPKYSKCWGGCRETPYTVLLGVTGVVISLINMYIQWGVGVRCFSITVIKYHDKGMHTEERVYSSLLFQNVKGSL